MSKAEVTDASDHLVKQGPPRLAPMASISSMNSNQSKELTRTSAVAGSLSDRLSLGLGMLDHCTDASIAAGSKTTGAGKNGEQIGDFTDAGHRRRHKFLRKQADQGVLAVVAVGTAGAGAAAGGFLVAVVKVGIILATKIFYPRAWPYLRAVCLLQVDPLASRLPQPVQRLAAPLRPFAWPMLGLSLAAPVLRAGFPDFWRTIRYWRRLLPIYAGYMKTKYDVRGKPLDQRMAIWAERHEWGGEKVYRLILDMSGFYVKSAQVIASKSDFMPAPWVRRLSVLFDSAPPRPFDEVSRSMRRQLALTPSGKMLTPGRDGLPPLDAAFRAVESTALAAASIAQVHSGLLHDGTSVVIKVQHLGMESLMNSDLRNIGRVASFLKNQLPFDLTAVVKEIQTTIPLEFDFEREVAFMKRIKDSLTTNGFSRILCPAPILELCSKRMIVMEKLEGVPYTRILASVSTTGGSPMAAEAATAVHSLLEAYGQMLLVDGVFHADPHPGNLLLMADGRLGLLDFGQSKALDERSKVQLAGLVLALAEGRSELIAEALTKAGMEFGGEDGRPEAATLAKMSYMMFDTRPLPEAVVSPLSQDSLLQNNPLTKFNQALWLVVRTMLLLRGLCHALRMDVSAAVIWKPYALRSLEESPSSLGLSVDQASP